MRAICAFATIGLILGSTGCALLRDTARVTTARVYRCINNHREKMRNRRWAKQAWQAVCRANPHETFSTHYADGFKDGFARYLYRGGTGEPPALAPARYRTIHYQNPEGFQAVQDWFSGYRHGAHTAQAGAYRRWVVGPSLVSDGPQTSPSPVLAPYSPIPDAVNDRPTQSPLPITPVPQPAKLRQSAAIQQQEQIETTPPHMRISSDKGRVSTEPYSETQQNWQRAKLGRPTAIHQQQQEIETTPPHIRISFDEGKVSIEPFGEKQQN